MWNSWSDRRSTTTDFTNWWIILSGMDNDWTRLAPHSEFRPAIHFINFETGHLSYINIRVGCISSRTISISTDSIQWYQQASQFPSAWDFLVIYCKVLITVHYIKQFTINIKFSIPIFKSYLSHFSTHFGLPGL